MLQFYLSEENSALYEVNNIQKNCWINMIHPTEGEIRQVSSKLNIPLDFIVDALDNYERSRVERDEDKVLIIVDFPIMINDETYETIPIGMIITEHNFITVCLKESPILDGFVNNHIKSFFTFKKTRFALQILQVIASHYLRDLKTLNRRTEVAEKSLHESVQNKNLFALMNIEKSLVYFLTSLKSNKLVLDKMMRQNFLKMYEDDDDLLDDVIIEMNQAIEMAGVHSSILSGMMDVYASIISNNMNDVMKFLTLFTIILTVPTLVFSFYGMNVDLPFEHTPLAWIITIVISLFLAAFLAWIFWKKKFF